MPKPKRVQPAQKGAQDIEMSNYEKKRLNLYVLRPCPTCLAFELTLWCFLINLFPLFHLSILAAGRRTTHVRLDKAIEFRV
jgi:hypothetical protein